jgi:heme/copper-type cytochrome/quinol oxidase subunit 3
MANEIFNTPVLPGTTPLPKHEHRRLMIVFIIVAVIIIAALLTYYFSTNTSVPAPQTTAPVVDQQTLMRQAVVSQLNTVTTPLTSAQINQINSQMKNTPVVTDAQKATVIKQLQTPY